MTLARFLFAFIIVAYVQLPNALAFQNFSENALTENSASESVVENLDGTYDRIYYSRTYRLGNGVTRTWVKVDDLRRPVGFGVILSNRALDGLSPHEMKTIRMHLPIAVPPYTDVEVDWNPHGHEPDGVYNIPHFDIHFFMYPFSVRSQVTCAGEDLARCEMRPADRYVPQDYVWTPGGVPMMGSHWIDPNSPEWKGDRFTYTMIYGFYDGSMAFIEPMITREFLRTKAEVSSPIKQPVAVEKTGWYPTTYSVKFNVARDRYEISMENLVYRESDQD